MSVVILESLVRFYFHSLQFPLELFPYTRLDVLSEQ